MKNENFIVGLKIRMIKSNNIYKMRKKPVESLAAAAAATSSHSTSFEMQIDPTSTVAVSSDDYVPQEMDYEIIEINKMRAETDTSSTVVVDMDVDTNQVDIDTIALRIIAVLDTNIFISNLGDLEAIAAKHRDDILFTVPWVVLQELDGLKSSSSSISDKSKRAIRFIHTVLSNRSTASNFLFENSTQVV